MALPTWKIVYIHPAGMFKTFTDACDDIDTCEFIAVDVESEDLHRDCMPSILQICTGTNDKFTVYIFDLQEVCIMTMIYLRNLLNGPIVKLMWDARTDSDVLKWQCRIELANVIDLQVVNCMIRKHRKPKKEFKYLTGLSKGYECIPKSYQKWTVGCFKKTDADGLSMFEPKFGGVRTTWNERPLNITLAKYACSDVIRIMAIWEYAQAYITLARACDACKFRLDEFRALPERVVKSQEHALINFEIPSCK
jgi:ribonuclease D